MNDQLLIEQAYRNIYENKKVLIPRRSKEERQKNYNIALQKKLQEYIKNGSVGDLDLGDTPITNLSKGLTVNGSFNLCHSSITSLPQGLKVNGSLYLSYTPITSLNVGLKVGGNLILFGTPITSIPEGIEVGGDLDLRATSITSLPIGLKVGGNLSLFGTPISKQYTKEQLKEMLPNVKGEISF